MNHKLVIFSREARMAWLREHNALERLRKAGHSALKAQQIVLDAIRGDRYAITWALSAMGEK